MNTLLLHPTDILFFRDGRPMSGSLSGHGAAWPLPTVPNAALHAALHRADLEAVLGDPVHGHDQIRLRGGQRVRAGEDVRKFGSLVTAGPFPVGADGTWFFPRPGDAQQSGSTAVTLHPLPASGPSSLPAPLRYPVANSQVPTKARPEPWWSAKAWAAYLNSTALTRPSPASEPDPDFTTDGEFSDAEHTIGIGIDEATGTQDGKSIYSAHYLRLREGWRLGVLAEAHDKIGGDPGKKRDLVESLFPSTGPRTPVIVGGQQRLCTVSRLSSAGPLPIPTGMTGGFPATGSGADRRWHVKWILLTPGIWPAIGGHPGGCLPSWVDLEGNVQLLDGPGKNAARRHRLPEGKRIPARLVAALTGKPIPVTGYALPHEAADRMNGGAKSTHLAVPAGAVYYFQCESESSAHSLAAALNWHGSGPADAIRNRRSTLMGEKGFGLGVCGTWDFPPGPSHP